MVKTKLDSLHVKVLDFNCKPVVAKVRLIQYAIWTCQRDIPGEVGESCYIGNDCWSNICNRATHKCMVL